MSLPIKLIVVDDHPVALQGLSSYLNEDAQITVIADALNGKLLLAKIESGLVPNVIIMDLDMPEMGGLEAMEIVNRKFPEIKVILLSVHNEPALTEDCLAKGACAFLHKTTDLEKIAKTIIAVHKNEPYSKIITVPDESTNRINKNPDKLTDKEIEVIVLTCEGFLIKQIAAKLDRSINTIDYHKSNIAKKTKCKNDAQLGIYAKKYGFIK